MIWGFKTHAVKLLTSKFMETYSAPNSPHKYFCGILRADLTELSKR